MGRGLRQDSMLEQTIIFRHYHSLHLAEHERLHTSIGCNTYFV